MSEAQGVTFTPWHIAVSLEDVQNAHLGNLVTLLHEASESLTMTLNPVIKGHIAHAIEESLDELRAKARAFADENRVGLASEHGAFDLLAETLGQKMAARGIPEAPSLVQAMIRWVKDLYYRVTMAAQRAFGAEPDPETSLAWFENQLRRIVSGDYDTRIGRMLDRYLTEPLVEHVRRFTGHADTPGGLVDFLDPVSGKMRQPWVEPTIGDAIRWNVEFRQNGSTPGGEDIPEPEAYAREDAAANNLILDAATDWFGKVGTGKEWDEFWSTIGVEEDPKIRLQIIEGRFPTAGNAKVGGERMTEVMNGEANLKARRMVETMEKKLRDRQAKAAEAIKAGDVEVENADKDLQRMEADPRNAALHEDKFGSDLKTLVTQFVRDYSRGLDTAELHGQLAQAVRQAEGLIEHDPVPQHYQEVFKAILGGEYRLFDYMKGIAGLDLNLKEMTTLEIGKAIRDGADSDPALKELVTNKPLTVALSVLARRNSDQVDKVQFGWFLKTEQYLSIHSDLQKIRNATPDQLREILRTSDKRTQAAGLRGRLKYQMTEKRRALQAASNRLARAEGRHKLISDTLPLVSQKVEELQKSGGTAPSEWQAFEGAEWTAMKLGDDGTFTPSKRVLKFNPDGTAVDWEGIKAAVAENWEWLRRNEKKAGGAFYQRVKRQTEMLSLKDVQRKYPIGWSSLIDRMVVPIGDQAQSLGHSAGTSIKQRLNRFQQILKVHLDSQVLPAAHFWDKAWVEVSKAAGIPDYGQLRATLYNPIAYFLNVNPGLDEPAALRRAVRMARARLPKEPAANFNEKFIELIRRTKEVESMFPRLGEKYGAYVKDDRLQSGLRKAVPTGYLTTPRGINAAVVQTIVREMTESGWQLKYKDQVDSKGKPRPAVVGSTTFDSLKAAEMGIDATAALDKTLQGYFTAGVKERWLKPFIDKPGKEVFTWGEDPISQFDVQNSWEKSGGNVLNWIDSMAQAVKLEPEGEKDDPLGRFRLSILKQLDSLFGMEAKLAYDATRTRDIFDPMGPKAHVAMDARQNDLLPAEHVDFQMFDPTSAKMLLGQIAYHAAFGRNAEGMIADMEELKSKLQLRDIEYKALRATTKNARVAEAVGRGWDYNELKASSERFGEALALEAKLKGLLGVDNPGGPFNDMKGGMEFLHAIAGQIVDNPKVGLYHFMATVNKPLVMKSLGPMAIADRARDVGNYFKTFAGGMMNDLNLHLMHSSEYAKEVGSIEGGAFRNLPWGVALSDIGKEGKNQTGFTNKWVVRPLRALRALQKKGVAVNFGNDDLREFPRIAMIPGLGVLGTMGNVGATTISTGIIRRLELFMRRGINHFANDREAFDAPAYRFTYKDLGVGRFDRGVLDWYRNKTVEYGLGTLEDMVRRAMPEVAKGGRLLTKEQVQALSIIGGTDFTGTGSINTTPGILMTNPMLRMMMPLMRWPLWAMHQTHLGLNTADGRRTLQSVMRGLGTLAAWNLPMGIAFTFMLDEYDEKLLKKKSNLPGVDKMAMLPFIGPAMALAAGDRTIGQNAVGILARAARSGQIYGLAADMLNQFLAPYDPNSGQRAFSMDQRVLVMSQFLNFQQAGRNLMHQGTATWASVWRPFLMAVGGNGAINTVDLINGALGLDNQESRLMQRINAGNWLRAAGQETEMEIRPGGAGEAPTRFRSGLGKC